MLEKYFKKSKIQNYFKSSSYPSSIDTYAEYLCKQRYDFEVVRIYLRGVIHFSYWLKTKHIPLFSINETTVNKFLASHIKKCFCPTPKGGSFQLCRSALKHYLAVLRDNKLVDLPPPKPILPVDKVLRNFGNFLEKIKGLTALSIRIYSRYIREFIKAMYRDAPINFQKLVPNDIKEYVICKAKVFNPKTTQLLRSSLRTFFDFLRITKQIKFSLKEAVPAVPCRRLSSIPKYLTDEQLECLLASFNLSSCLGLRDRAMALLMARLGLRCGEVSQLKLEDLNWRQGIIMIKKNKSRQDFSLPLTREVGEALTSYLKKGRPKIKERQIFLTKLKPYERPLSATGVGTAIRRAFKRCIPALPFYSAHNLRHTLATQLLNKGATLKQIADILHHRSIETTNIYAKVDLKQLSEVALPFPEVQYEI